MKNNFFSEEYKDNIRRDSEEKMNDIKKPKSNSKTREITGFQWPAGHFAEGMGHTAFNVSVNMGMPHIVNNIALCAGWACGLIFEIGLEQSEKSS